MLGFKKITEFLKDKLHLWAERSSDTGMRYPFDENAKYYLEAHEFFLTTIDKIEKSIELKDESE